MKTLRLFMIVLLCSVRGEAQMVHTMVQPDRVVIGPEFIPRRADLPMQLIVPAGQTVELTANSVADYIEVAGTLRVSRAHDTITRFTHLVVLPGGYLDVGTQADPIPCDRRVEFIVRNVAIDTARDPFQWGNGLVNFGRQTRVGCSKLAWTIVTSDLRQGDTSLTLSDDPSGWAVGDELLIPDTAQSYTPRREAVVTVKSIAGRVIGLSKPLDFAHLAITDPDGGVVLLPRVANLTRNVVIRSEDPTGTPGHTVNIGPDSNWDLRFNELRGIGRTKNIPLDSTSLATGHIGTNPPARYCLHDHHAQGFGSFTVGNVCVGQGINGGFGKWGYSVHQTSDVLVQDNVMVDFPGAGIVTEDGNEVRVVFRHNFVAYALGNHNGDVNSPRNNVLANNPGADGTGVWARGVKDSTFDGNEVWNAKVGINLFIQDLLTPTSYPSLPGGPVDTLFDRLVSFPALFTNNVTAANVVNGLEYWGVTHFPATNHTAAYNGVFQFSIPVSEAPKAPWFVNPRFVCHDDRSMNASAISANSGYIGSLEIYGGTLAGCYRGIENGAVTVTLKNVRLQNQLNLSWAHPPTVTIQENVLHVPMPGKPVQFISFGYDTVWNGIDRLPKIGEDPWVPQRGSQHTIINWQGTGQNFQLFEKQSLAASAAWPAFENAPYAFACPDAGLTMGQCWTAYGIAYGHEPVDVADTVPLQGLIAGLARPGITPRLGPARAVITSPNARTPAILQGGGSPYVLLVGLLTGDTTAPRGLLVSVDGDAPIAVTPDPNDTFSVRATHVSEGLHTVTTSRTDASGNPTGTPMVFHYVVGPPVAPPVPVCPPPSQLVGSQCVLPLPAPQTVTVPNVVGQTQAAAAAALSAAGLRLGTVTTQPSTFVGVVLSESPAAGATVAKDSAVNLVVSVAPPTPPAAARTIVKVTTCQETTRSDGSIDKQCIQVVP